MNSIAQPIAALDTASTIRADCIVGGLAPHRLGQDQLSDQIFFFLQLPTEAVQFGFRLWTNSEAAFG
jgi:hypothetical protein